MNIRSALFIPADRADLVAKAGRVDAGAVILDLEDGVGFDAKASARQQLGELLDLLRETTKSLVAVRVNHPSSPMFSEDLGALPQGLDAVVVPKLAGAAEAADALGALEAAGQAAVGLVAGIETAAGVLNANETLSLRGITGCYFGAEDLVGDLGGRRSAEGLEVLYARSHVAICARVAGIAALDQIVADFGNDDRFLADAAQGRSLGYAGKMCIHPAQVALAESAFTPSADELAEARAILDALSGGGVAVVDGRMVDGPMAEAARRTLARAGLDA